MMDIPADLSEPCFFADASDDVIYNGGIRGGYWAEKGTRRDAKEGKKLTDDVVDIRPLINDFLRKMAKFRHQENQDVSAGTRIRFFIDKPAAMISFPRAVIKYL